MINPFHPGRGRGPHRTLEEARILVCQWRASGQSKQAWCNDQGILPTALNSCLNRTQPTHHPFIELQRRPPHAAAAHVVRLSLAGSLAAAELTVADLAALIQHLSEGRS